MPTITGPLKIIAYPHATALDAVITLTDSSAGTPADTLAAQLAATAAVAVTDNSGGTPATTIAVIGATYAQAEVANAVASLAARVVEAPTKAGVDAQLAIIRNSIASLARAVNRLAARIQ